MPESLPASVPASSGPAPAAPKARKPRAPRAQKAVAPAPVAPVAPVAAPHPQLENQAVADHEAHVAGRQAAAPAVQSEVALPLHAKNAKEIHVLDAEGRLVRIFSKIKHGLSEYGWPGVVIQFLKTMNELNPAYEQGHPHRYLKVPSFIETKGVENKDGSKTQEGYVPTQPFAPKLVMPKEGE